MATVREGKSGFDGGLAGLAGVNVGAFLLTLLTLGLAYPWALCWRQGWLVRHQVVDGRRLRFDGTGGSLVWRWLKLWCLCVVTLGVYSLWAGPYMRRWAAEHVHLEAP